MTRFKPSKTLTTSLFLLSCLVGKSEAASLPQSTDLTTYRWRGPGTFSVVYEHSQTSMPCSFVEVEVAERSEQIHLSTQYNCEDSEDQEFVPLTLERQGEQLFYNKNLVGTYQDRLLKIQLQVGRQIEIYKLDFSGANLRFHHSSNLGGPGTGVLEADVPLLP